MKTFTFAIILAAAGFVAAAPSPQGPISYSVQFQGATPEAVFYQSFPGNGQVQWISNDLSISHIEFGGGATCYFYGIDNSFTKVGPGAETVDVGPPQTQIKGECYSA